MTWLAPAGAFLVGVIAFPPTIGGLGRLGLQGGYREGGPDSHMAKEGTPTAGGILFPLILLLAWLAFARDPAGGLLVGAAMLGGAVGFLDDWLKMQHRDGLSVKGKFGMLLICAALLAFGMHQLGFDRQVIPGLGPVDLGVAGLALAALAALATSNGVNLSDGVDGLTAGAAIPAFLACGALAWLEHRAALAGSLFALAAVLAAFLIYNLPKAKLFMGDAGSLALGLALAVAAAEVGALILLPVLGLVFLGEALSVMIQVGSFKLRHGRRVFRMSPFHHHLEVGGMSEWGIDLRFWAVAWVGAAATVLWAVWSGLPGIVR